MSDASNSGFAQFVPGFDFLQNLTKSSMPQLPNMGSWIAPTLSVEELEKRIAELKAVHFWLDQNTKALAATVQALEVQKMTLATLKSMNLNLAEVAKAFTPKAADSVAPVPPQASAPPIAPVAEAADQGEKLDENAKPAAGAATAGLGDPMQLWSALTQQFQAIAASAMAEVGKTTAKDAGKNPIKGTTKPIAKVTESTPKAPAKKTAVKRAATKTPAKKAAATADAPARGLRRR